MKKAVAAVLASVMLASFTSMTFAEDMTADNKTTIFIASDSTAQTYKQSIYYPEIG